MKRRFIVSLVAVSLASGLAAFSSKPDRPEGDSLALCPDTCCQAEQRDCGPPCCGETEMCCE